MKRLTYIAATIAVLGGLLLGCGGQNVKPVDLDNPAVSVESRRFVADAEDAVSIARARVSQRENELERARRSRAELMRNQKLEDAAESVRSKLEDLLDERVELQDLQVELAEANLELAQIKLELAHAQTAVRHDLRTYELEPLRDKVDGQLKDVRKVKNQIGDQLLEIDEVTRAWWTTYKSEVAGTELADAFFTPQLPEQSSPFWVTAERIQAMEAGEDEAEGEGDEEGKGGKKKGAEK
jgi:chromosome segregation ATPase